MTPRRKGIQARGAAASSSPLLHPVADHTQEKEKEEQTTTETRPLDAAAAAEEESWLRSSHITAATIEALEVRAVCVCLYIGWACSYD